MEFALRLAKDISTHSLTKRLTITSLKPSFYNNISTHSLTKRLTVYQMKQGGLLFPISTHSLTKRLTEKRTGKERYIKYFNSQPHEEADLYEEGHAMITHISTHSLTKRLTKLG